MVELQNDGSSKKPFQRRTDVERNQVGDYYGGSKRYYDQNFEVTVVKIFSGECYVTSSPGEMIVTILGSCVSACIRDPIAGVGGMNHFLLPGDGSRSVSELSLTDANRYGVNAMEFLINEILKRGGVKSRLEVKVFGGGNVTASSAMIGSKNSEFVRTFLRNEGLKTVSEDLGGTLPRRIHYYPDTGKVMVRKLNRREDMEIVDREKKYEQTLHTKPIEGDIDLF